MSVIDFATANSLLKELYPVSRIESLVFDRGALPLSSYLGLSEFYPLREPRSKSRRWRHSQDVAVIRDGLEQCGLYPFRRADWFPDLRTDEDKAEDLIGRGLLGWLPRSPAGRVELIQNLTAAGLLETSAARRVIAAPTPEPTFFGIDRGQR